MKKSKQIIWAVASIVMFIVSAVMVFLGRDKMVNYHGGESLFPQNVYVGGDAYNYIINTGYASNYFLLALIFVVMGIGFLIIHYLEKIKTIKENGSIIKETRTDA